MLFFHAKPSVGRILIDDPMFNAAAKLRYEVYCEELGFLDKNNYPEKLETDGYDPNSVHIIVRIGKVLAGYARVIFPRDDKLPILEHFLLGKAHTHQDNCEVSRVIISKKYRMKIELKREIFKLLTEEITKIARERNVDIIYTVAEEWLLKSLMKRGYNFEKIGEGKHHMGAVTYPTRLQTGFLKPNSKNF